MFISHFVSDPPAFCFPLGPARAAPVCPCSRLSLRPPLLPFCVSLVCLVLTDEGLSLLRHVEKAKAARRHAPSLGHDNMPQQGKCKVKSSTWAETVRIGLEVEQSLGHD